MGRTNVRQAIHRQMRSKRTDFVVSYRKGVEMNTCEKCRDTGEIKIPVSDYIRQLDVKAGRADRPLFTPAFCACKFGKNLERKIIDARYN